MSYREVYEKWCNDPYFDEASREELKALEGNEAEIEDRFYRQLEFGTGGLRGVIGAGTSTPYARQPRALPTTSFPRTDRKKA